MNTEVFDKIDFIDIEQVADKLINATKNTDINNKISNFLCAIVNIFDIWNINQNNNDWYKYLPTEFTDQQKQQIAAFFIKIEPLLISFKKQSRKTRGGVFPIRTVELDQEKSNQEQKVSELTELVGTASFLKQIERYLLSQQIPEEISSEITFSEIAFLLNSLHTFDDRVMSLIGPSKFTSNNVVTPSHPLAIIIRTISDIYKSVAESMLLPTFYLYIPLLLFASISDMMSADVRQEDIITSLCNIYGAYPYLFDLTCDTFVIINQLIVPDKESVKISNKLKVVSNLIFLIKIFVPNEFQLDIIIETFKSLINKIHETPIFPQIKGVTLKDIYKMIVLLDTQTEKDILGDERIQEVLKQLAKNHCIAQLFNIIKLPLTDSL